MGYANHLTRRYANPSLPRIGLGKDLGRKDEEQCCDRHDERQCTVHEWRRVGNLLRRKHEGIGLISFVNVKGGLERAGNIVRTCSVDPTASRQPVSKSGENPAHSYGLDLACSSASASPSPNEISSNVNAVS